MGNIPKITELDFVVLDVLWKSSKNMTIQEIAAALQDDRKLSAASVAQVIRRLLKKKAVRQMESILVSNVYARTFQACISREEVVSARIRELESEMSSMGLAAAILKYASPEEKIEDKELEEMQHLLDLRRRKK